MAATGNTQARLRDLTAYSAAHAGARPFEATVVRFGPGDGEFSVMNREQGGWGQRSYTYRSLWEVARHWRVAFVSIGTDACSGFVRVEPLAVAAVAQCPECRGSLQLVTDGLVNDLPAPFLACSGCEFCVEVE